MEIPVDDDYHEIPENISTTSEDEDLMDDLEDENIARIDLVTTASSEEITVRWPKRYWPVNGWYWVHVERTVPPIGVHADHEWKYRRAWNETEYTFIAVPGCVHQITVEYRTNLTDVLVGSGSTTVTSNFSRSEQNELMKKAIEYAGTEFTEITYLYRCKPLNYWLDIKNTEDCIMHKYDKDYSGQPANHINGKLQGLFFASKLIDGKLPVASPFGNVRLKVPAEKLFKPSTNLYYCDFYCIKEAHYVTIIICEEGSEADKFCKDELILLSPHDNPFLKTVSSEGDEDRKFFVNKNLWVEVFITENLSIGDAQLDFVIPTLNGRSSRYGMPNKKTCSICNLYPRGGGY